MFMAFVGLIDAELTERCIRGNGKTCAMTYYLYRYHLNGKEIWTNYHTSFSAKVIGFQEMINRLKEMKQNEEKINVILGVTEMQDLISSLGSTKEQTMFVDSFANQMRKLNTDCLYDTQVLKSIQIKLRRHTENIRIPIKLHEDETPCNFDRCDKKHFIDICSYQPWRDYPVRRIRADVVGKMYNSQEMIVDELIIPKQEKGQKVKAKNFDDEIEKEIIVKEEPITEIKITNKKGKKSNKRGFLD